MYNFWYFLGRSWLRSFRIFKGMCYFKIIMSCFSIIFCSMTILQMKLLNFSTLLSGWNIFEHGASRMAFYGTWSKRCLEEASTYFEANRSWNKKEKLFSKNTVWGSPAVKSTLWHCYLKTHPTCHRNSSLCYTFNM